MELRLGRVCGPRSMRVTGVLVVVVSVLTGCGGSGDEGAGGDSVETTTTLAPVVNFFETPSEAQALVDKMVNPDTPVVALNFNQNTVTVQERGRPDAYVIHRPVAPGELGPTSTTLPVGDEVDGEAPAAPPVAERGVTVLRSEMSTEEFDALNAELAAIDERNSGVVSDEAAEPIDTATEPYRFGPDRVDVWSYSATSSQAVRSPVKLRTSDIELLDEKVFVTTSIDWAALTPLMERLLMELDLGDTETIKNINIFQNPDNPGTVNVSIFAEGERGSGSLTRLNGEVQVQRG